MTTEQIKLLEALDEGEVVINDTTVHLLNGLLVNKEHYQHQSVAKMLQDIGSPSTIPFVKQVLESNFDYLQYTYSEDYVIAKWFSWLLFSINTEESISLIEEYAQSPNEGIREEMQYRLRRIKSRQ